jgi:DNA-binding transcriptional LysR family regulator
MNEPYQAGDDTNRGRSILRGLDLNSIRLALNISDHRSLRRAAKSVGISESSISHRLRSLEDVLTVALFHRSSEGVEPTNAGKEFFARSREALRILDLAVADAASTSRGMAGRLTVGLYTSLSDGRLRAALAEFSQNHPATRIEIIEGSRSRMIEGLNARTIDVTVLVGFPDPVLGEALPLWREQTFAIVQASHSIAQLPKVPWDRLADEVLLFSTRDAGPEASNALIARIGGSGRWPTRRLHNVNRDTLLTLVAMGSGVAVMIESDLGCLPTGAVAVPLYDADGPTKELLTAYRDPGNDNPPLRRFWSLLRSSYVSLD